MSKRIEFLMSEGTKFLMSERNILQKILYLDYLSKEFLYRDISIFMTKFLMLENVENYLEQKIELISHDFYLVNTLIIVRYS